MTEHSDLIAEMPFLEKLNTDERLKLARKRRSAQLKKFAQREKEYHMKRRRQEDESSSNRKNAGYKVHFISSVMLLEAATRNDVEEVKRLLMLGVSPDSTNEDGLTALHQCCIDNCEEMMLLLIEFGANVNAEDSEHWTPLHAAATCGHLHLIKILIEKGANLLAVNADGNMPYDICEDEQTLDYIESEMAKRGVTQELIDETRAMTENMMLNDMRHLVAHGHDLNYKDAQGATPLHIAASNGYLSVVEFLLDNNASTEECDDDLWQPIHAAACWGHIDVVEFLVQNGADLDAKTKNGETPFDICEDPDLKSRLLHLRSEIESKRAVNLNRLRRSHSQNTRTHSIRRTSIREKSQIAKREAIEEARIWQEKTIDVTEPQREEETDGGGGGEMSYYSDYKPHTSTDSPPIELNNIDVGLDSGGESGALPQQTLTAFSHSSMHHNSSYKNSYNERTIDVSKSSTSSSNNITTYQQGMPLSVKAMGKKSESHSTESYYNPDYYNEHHDNNMNNYRTTNGASGTKTNDSSNDSVKVEIHVTVNTNANANATACGSTNNNNSNPYNTNSMSATAPAAAASNNAGTLIDLKKQRSEKHRNSLNNVYNDRMMPQAIGEQPTAANKCSAMHHASSGAYGANNYNNYHHQPSAAGNVSTIPNAKTLLAPSALFDTPPSPTNVKKKFRGNASELVGDDHDKKGCCIIC